MQTFENWQKVMPQNQTVYTDLLGRNFKTEYADGTYSMNYYNSKNQLVQSVTPGGVVTLYTYDNLGRQISQAIDMNRNGEIDAADLVTSTAYSYGTQNGKTVSITTQTRSQGANSAVISVKKQSVDGLESWQTNLNGLTTHTKLERLGGGNTRQTVTNPDGTKVVTNSNNGRVITVQNINSDNTNGNLITYTYDEFDRQAGTVETFGTVAVNTSTATYDSNGNILTQTVNGQTTGFEYDVMGRRTKVTAPGGVVTNTAYYPTGDIRRVDGATYPVEYTYNALGKQATMKTFKDADTPQVTSWTYNARGEMVQKTYADGNSVNYTYNADGQLLTRTWARGIVTTYTYDNAGRATGYSYSDGVTPAVVITFDFLDRQNSITDAAGMRSFSYNANNQLGNETNPSIMNGMITYTYDNAGRRAGMNLSNGTDFFAQANYTYDTRGRIATVGNNTDTLTYTYIPGTNMVGSSAWQNASINTINTYDQYKRLTNIAVNGSNVYGYTLNDKNQRTSATLPDGNKWNYTYDVMGQLTGAVKQDSANNSLADMNYFYDLIGNRTSATENSATTTYVSNLVNQYTAVNTVVPVYDLDGNMTGYNGWTYTYNGENRLIVAENSGTGVRVEADYDYMGRRIFKKVYNNNALTKHSVFIYDGFKQIAELDVLNNSSLKASYLWQPVGLDVVLLRNNEYLIADGNKNIIQVRNVAGGVTDSYVYDPFGKVIHSGSSENSFHFSSEFIDSETRLVYYNYRYYIPNLGRWINRDPLEEEGCINLYSIVNNSINNSCDENGEIPLDTIWDLGNIIYDIAVGDTVSLAADTAALLIPYVPAGTTKIAKLTRLVSKAKADDVIDICETAKRMTVSYEYSYQYVKHLKLNKNIKGAWWKTTANKAPSQFAPGTSHESVRGLISEAFESAAKQGKFKPQELDGFVFDTGRVIGASNGKKVTKIKIHINPDGKGLHAYPID